MKKLTLSLTIIATILTGCLKDEDIKLNYESYLPAGINDDWEISSSEKEGFDSNKLDLVYRKFYSEEYYPTLRSLLIVRNGKLIAEAYCKNKSDRDSYHDVKSVTKSITSLLIGKCIEERLIDSIDAPIYQYIPEFFDGDLRKQKITIRHALKMQSGLAYENRIHDKDMYYYNGSSLEYVLSKELISTPGLAYYYHDGNPQLLSGIIKKVSGMNLEEYANKHLFTPLGIEKYQWEKAVDGLNFGGFGLWMKSRDMAKIGKLVIQNGQWNGQQIIPAQWITESTKIQEGAQEHGYYWKVYDNGEIYCAKGHGGQYILMVPKANLVVVLTADAPSREWILSPGYGTLFSDIIDAIDHY